MRTELVTKCVGRAQRDTWRHFGGLRVFYRPHGAGWQALAAMSKYDDRPQRAAIARILAAFPSEDR